MLKHSYYAKMLCKNNKNIRYLKIYLSNLIHDAQFITK